jgi:hypothetical protein
MEAQELYLKDGKSTGIFFCSICRTVHRSKEEAESCCVCSECRSNKQLPHSTLCTECKARRNIELAAMEADKKKEILDKAEVVRDWKFLWFNDKMYKDVDILLDDCQNENISIPEFVHPMKPITFEGFDLSVLLDDFTDNIMIEDMDSNDIASHLKGLDQLQEAFRKFNEANSEIIMYYVEDYSKKVRIER